MIRKASINDLRRICKLERVCFKKGFRREQIESLLMNPSAFSIVHEEDRKIVGSLIFYNDGKWAKILTIAVHPSFRNRGIGKGLMIEAEKMIKRLRILRITLEVSTRNDSAVGLYKSLGYQFDGVLENYYTWGDDAYCMSKRIGR